MLDLAVIGAGPCGLAVGVAAKRARLTCSLFDKGPVASSLMRYPLYMTFFSTPDKLEIGVPFVTAGDKPTRREALTYYRKVAEHFELDVRQYHTVSRATRTRDGFELVAQHPGGTEPETVSSRHLVFATGYFESPNPLRVPGVIELGRGGGRVALGRFLSEFDRGVKGWMLAGISSRVKEGRVAVRWCSRVVEIRRAEVAVRRDPDGPRETIPADRPDRDAP